MSTTDTREKAINQAKTSLDRMRNFDISTLPRRNILGDAFNFESSVQDATRLFSLYRQLPIDAVDSFSEQLAQELASTADADFSVLDSILQFDANTNNPSDRRQELMSKIAKLHEQTFNRLYPIIAYGVGRVTDFATVERDARAMFQSIKDQQEKAATDLEQSRNEAAAILDDIRKVAAEQGVSQQSIYFKDESIVHDKSAKYWSMRTYLLAAGLAFFALGSVALHKWSWLAPTNVYEAIQLTVSKVLVFSTIGYMLVLSARNYLAHRHNAVVNKHRQNALMTYKALVDAGGDSTNRDVVLMKAAECIFGPQSTGFGKSDGPDSGTMSMVSFGPGAFRESIPSS